MSDEFLKRMHKNLQRTQKVYARLIEIAEQKQKHIVQNDIEQLRQDIEVEQKLAGEGADLNAERDEIHRGCCATLRGATEAVKLEDLCKCMPEAWSVKINHERKLLRQTLERLQNINRMNAALVNHSLDLMRGLLSALFDTQDVSAYGRRGRRMEIQPQARALDARI